MKFGRLGMLSIYLSLFLSLGFLTYSLGTPVNLFAASPNSIIVDVVPQNPNPGETVNISLNSYANNLDSVLISWSVDGKSSTSGIGKKTFSVKAPSAGAESNIIASIALPDGNIDTKIIVRPAEMSLLWQATDSYVPPFYKGKALPTPGSEIKVVAMPELRNGSQNINPKNLVYSWKKDYSNSPDASGYGKNFMVYTNDYLESTSNVSAIASSVDQNHSSEANLTIGTVNPQIEFYKNDPILGTIWEHALLDGHKVPGDEIIEASPYFVSPRDIRLPSLVFNWFINDVQIAMGGVKKNLFPVKVQKGISVTSKIKV